MNRIKPRQRASEPDGPRERGLCDAEKPLCRISWLRILRDLGFSGSLGK